MISDKNRFRFLIGVGISAALTACMDVATQGKNPAEPEVGVAAGDTTYLTESEFNKLGYEVKDFYALGSRRTGLLKNWQGNWIWGGDMIVDLAEDVEGPALSKASANWANAPMWPNGIIPYTADAAIATMVDQAAAEWNKRSGIKWVPRAKQSTPATDYVYFHGMSDAEAALVGYEGLAPIGKRTGKSTVFVRSMTGLSTYLHEMGHVMGLLHEHQRPDRDNYITLGPSGVENTPMCKEGTFIIDAWDVPGTHHPEYKGPNFFATDVCPKGGESIGAFDNYSIMQYGYIRTMRFCLAYSPDVSGCTVSDGWFKGKNGLVTPVINTAITGLDAWAISFKYNTMGSSDLVGIRRIGTSSGKTEVSRVSSIDASGGGFSTFNFQGATTFPVTNSSQVDYITGDYDGDGVEDLWMIAYGNNNTQVTIASGATNYSTVLLSPTRTALVDNTNRTDWVFCVGDLNNDKKGDLYAVHRTNPGGVIVRVLSGANKFSTFLDQRVTAINWPSTNFDFAVGDYNGDGKPDLYGIYRLGASGTEVHVLNGANNFSGFLLQIVTVVGQTNSDWSFKLRDWNRDGKPDLYFIYRNGGSGTEVHVTSGAANYRAFLTQRVTALPKLNSDWEVE